MNVLSALYYVAKMKADPYLNSRPIRRACVPRRENSLDLYGAAGRIKRARELNKEAVTDDLNFSTAVGCKGTSKEGAVLV
jgi:hypothetical protein